MAYDFSRQVPYDILSSKALEDAWLQSQIFGGKWYGKANSNLYNQGCTERLSITDNLAAIQNQKESANYWAGILSGVDGSLKMYENGNGNLKLYIFLYTHLKIRGDVYMRKDIFERMRFFVKEDIKPNFSQIARQYGVDRRTAKTLYDKFVVT